MSQLTAASKTLPSMTTPRFQCAATAVNGKLCAVGGVGRHRRLENSIELYDIVWGGRWTQSPSKMNRHRIGCAAAIGNSVYVAGGHGCQSVEAFDIQIGLWRTLPSMSVECYGCAAVAVGDEFFVFGGHTPGQTSHTAESFNVEMGRWGDLPPMNNRRFECDAAVINNKVYIVGGYDYETRSILDTVEVFDLTTRTWTLLPHRMTTRRQGCAAAAVGNYLIVAGGHDGTSCLNSIEVYDIDSEIWSGLPPMPTKRYGCAAVSLGGSVYIMGGRDENIIYLDTMEEIQFNDNVIKGMLAEWSEGSWSNDVLPLIHRHTSIVHKRDVDVASMPTLLSRVGGEARVQTVYEILRGEMGVFQHTWSSEKQKRG